MGEAVDVAQERPDPTLVRGVAERVLEEVAEDLGQTVGVGVGHGVPLHRELHVPPLRLGSEGRPGLAGRVGDGDRLAPGPPSPGLEAGEVEEVVHEALHPQGVVADRGEELPPQVLRRLIVQKGLGEAPHRGERCLELVRGVGHEVAADLFHAAQLGDLQERDHGPAPVHGTGGGDDGPWTHGDLPGPEGARHGLLQQAPELRVAHQGAHRSEGGGLLAELEEVPGGPVHPEDPGVSAEGHHPLGHGVDERLHLVPLTTQLGQPGGQLVGEAVEGLGELVELLDAHVTGRLPGEVAGGEGSGALGEIDQGPAEGAAQGIGHHQGE